MDSAEDAEEGITRGAEVGADGVATGGVQQASEFGAGAASLRHAHKDRRASDVVEIMVTQFSVGTAGLEAEHDEEGVRGWWHGVWVLAQLELV